MSKVKEAYKEIENVVGSDYITDKDFMKAAYSRNVDPAFPDRWADMIIRPETSEEVSEIVKIANKFKIRIIPRGGGADLVGGSVTEAGILLDLTRMNRIIEINETDYYCEVECGITWGVLVSELFKRDLHTGVLGPGSGYSATVGGGLSNSTAGFGSTKYGLVPDICLGVEVVLGNPQGTILRTGAAANRYAQPFCRYGVAPDFTGLFMGDVGTMGIKTKAFLKLFPKPEYMARRDYMLLSKDFNDVTKLVHKLQKEIGNGLHDIFIVPKQVVDLRKAMVEPGNKPEKRARVKGPVFGVGLEACDQRIMDVYLEKLDGIMKNNNCREFEWQEIDTSEELAKDFELKLSYTYNYFNQYISLQPPMISCTTCHKVPISILAKASESNDSWYAKSMNDFPPRSFSIFAAVLYVLPNGHLVIVGGFNAPNEDECRKQSMEVWHSRIRHQVKYGGAHYWLGESISQSIVEAGAYTPEFVQFFKDMKKTVDPNFLLSPNKFHLNSYEDDMNKYIVKDDE